MRTAQNLKRLIVAGDPTAQATLAFRTRASRKRKGDLLQAKDTLSPAALQGQPAQLERSLKDAQG